MDPLDELIGKLNRMSGLMDAYDTYTGTRYWRDCMPLVAATIATLESLRAAVTQVSTESENRAKTITSLEQTAAARAHEDAGRQLTQAEFDRLNARLAQVERAAAALEVENGRLRGLQQQLATQGTEITRLTAKARMLDELIAQVPDDIIEKGDRLNLEIRGGRRTLAENRMIGLVMRGLSVAVVRARDALKP